MPRWKEVAAPLRFGFEVAASRLVWSAYVQADAIVVGRMLGSSTLGSYRFAINLASVPAEKISALIMRVTGPLFARIQDDHKLVRRYFIVISESFGLAILPLGLGLAITAPDVVEALLGPKWIGAVRPMQYLALFMALRDIMALFSQILTAQRKTKFVLWISIVNFAVMPISFYFAARWGAGAVAAAWIVLTPVTFLPTAIELFRTIDCKLREYMSAMVPPLAASVAMAIVVLAIRAWLLPAAWPVRWRLAAEVAAGGVVYAALLLGVCRSTVLKYIRFFAELRKGRTAPGETPLADLI
jgi:O-antigen/teichoic acid export membrane protein